MRSLPVGQLGEVAERWGEALRCATPKYPGLHVYGGRSFQDALATSRQLGARLLVVSAGLGLIDAATQIPAYACTVLENAPDSISARLEGSHSKSQWWRELQRVSPYVLRLDGNTGAPESIILAALSDNYIDMVGDDFVRLPNDRRARLRLFTRAPISRIPSGLRQCVMPYDDRLDGPQSPIKGTRSDFAGRAMRHFAEVVLSLSPDGSTATHEAVVRDVLTGWTYPQAIERQRIDDDEVRALLRTHWKAAGGGTARLLRLFRDDLQIACEQGRFASLARQVREELA